MLHFARSHDRHKADFLLDDWYGEWVRLLDKFHVVIFMHVHSHRGAILNEWVDVLAKDAMQADETDVPKSGPREHVSMSFPRPGESRPQERRRLRWLEPRCVESLQGPR